MEVWVRAIKYYIYRPKFTWCNNREDGDRTYERLDYRAYG